MPQFTLEAATSNGSSVAHGEERSRLTSLRDEIDIYLRTIESFATSDPADVMAQISSIHARLVGIRIGLQRSNSQRATAFRTKEVDPLIEALEFQFKVSSRIIALAEQEWKIAGGAS